MGEIKDIDLFYERYYYKHWCKIMQLSLDDFRSFLADISKLYSITSSIIKYYNEVIKPLNGKNVEELPGELKVAVLGGLKPDGEYAENAYALFIKDFIGLYIEDPKLYISKLKGGVSPSVKIVTGETRFIEFVRLLNNVSGFIINNAKNLGLTHDNVKADKTEIKQLNIEDLITELMNTILNLSIGVNSFSTSIWGLRKITPQYIKKAYGELPKELLKALGFSKLISLKNYVLWGFPDYFTKCILYEKSEQPIPGHGYIEYYITINGLPAISDYLKKNQKFNPVKPGTLGGAICILNEIIWRYVDLLHKDLNKWYKGDINLENEYVGKAWRSLNEVGWNIPEYLKVSNHEYLYADFKESLRGYIGTSYGSPFKFLLYEEDGIIRKYIQWVYRGSYERSGFSTFKLSQYIYLPELLDDLMPAIHLGVVDTTLYLDSRRALLILVRSPLREKQ